MILYFNIDFITEGIVTIVRYSFGSIFRMIIRFMRAHSIYVGTFLPNAQVIKY